MKYPYFSIIAILLLFLGVQNIQAQSCPEVDNLDFEEITNTTIEMNWDPHPTAVNLELEFFLDGLSVGIYSLPGSATSHIYFDNTGQLAFAQSISVTIRAECPSFQGWSGFTVANTETDIYGIDFLKTRCGQVDIKKGIFLFKPRKWKINLKCYCNLLGDFINEKGIQDEIPVNLREEFELRLQNCLIVSFNDENFPDKRISHPEKWDGNSITNHSEVSVKIANSSVIFENQNSIKRIMIYDILGKLIINRQNVMETKTEVNVEELKDGVYIFNISFMDGSQFSDKFYIND